MKRSNQITAAISAAIGEAIIQITVQRLSKARDADTRLGAFQRALEELEGLEKAGQPTTAADKRLFTLLCAVFPSVQEGTT